MPRPSERPLPGADRSASLAPRIVLALLSSCACLLPPAQAGTVPNVVEDGKLTRDNGAGEQLGRVLAARDCRAVVGGITVLWQLARGNEDGWSPAGSLSGPGSHSLSMGSGDFAYLSSTNGGATRLPWNDCSLAQGSDETVLAGNLSDPLNTWSLAVDQGWVAVGSELVQGGNRGEVLMFERNTFGFWIQQNTPLTGDGAVGERFGDAVAMEGSTLVVGAPGNVSANLAGKVFVFRLIGGEWMPFGSFNSPLAQTDDRFGTSVALWGNWLAVGAPLADSTAPFPQGTDDLGGVFLYERTSFLDPFVHRQSFFGAQALAMFGQSVAIGLGTLAVGAPFEDQLGLPGTPNVGAVHVYRLGSTWQSIMRLIASDRESGDALGFSVGVSSHGVLAGAPFSTGPDGFALEAGAMYYFLNATVDIFSDGFE